MQDPPIELGRALSGPASDVEQGQRVQTALVDAAAHVGRLVARIDVSVGQRRMVQEEAL